MGRIWSSAATQIPAQRIEHGASKLNWTEPGTPSHTETGPPPVTQRLAYKSDNPSGKRDVVAHACEHDSDEPAMH